MKMEGSEPLQRPQHERFAQELAKGASAYAAYEAAGYKLSHAAASRLSRNIKIAQRVRYLQASAAERVGVTIEGVLLEMKRIAMADASRIMKPDGTLSPPSDWPEDIRSVVSGLNVTVRPDGTVQHKASFADKNTALDKLAKHLGILSDGKMELSGPGGGPIATSLEVRFVDGAGDNADD